MNRIAQFLIPLVFSGFTSCENVSRKPQVQNIIFMIGDGMGATQVYLAMENSPDTLNMERAEFSGFSSTYSISSKITDSAAAGTALATGKKTKNGMIGMDTTGQVLYSILHHAEFNGLSTGLVSTSSLTHATPASFIAHESSRKKTQEIAADFLKTDIDVFIGGGYDDFVLRDDKLNLVDSLIAKGYQVDTTIENLMASNAQKLAGLLARNHLPKVLDGRGDLLSQATRKAIDVLSRNKKGFFLMVEGSQIDWGGHANDADYVLSETLDFDRALGVAMEFARNNPGTLVVVTSDHETGGLTLTGEEGSYNQISAQFSTGGHTAVMVPVFSYGTGAENFTGVLDNTDFFPKFMNLYGFDIEKE